MPAHVKLCALLAIFLVACGREPGGAGTPETPAPETPVPTSEVTIDTQLNPETAPQHKEQVWVLLVHKQGGPTEFFDQIVLREGSFESRDGLARGFAAVSYTKMPVDGFAAEQESPTEGTRKWSCFGSLMCTLEWTRKGKTETYISDGYEQKGDPFKGEWSIILTPENSAETKLSGQAHLDRGALDMSIVDNRYDGLVYFVRPASAGQPVDFLTVPPGALGQVAWTGVLMENGTPVGWDELKGDGQYSVGGRLTIREASGNWKTYQVSSEPKQRRSN